VRPLYSLCMYCVKLCLVRGTGLVTQVTFTLI